MGGKGWGGADTKGWSRGSDCGDAAEQCMEWQCSRCTLWDSAVAGTGSCKKVSSLPASSRAAARGGETEEAITREHRESERATRARRHGCSRAREGGGGVKLGSTLEGGGQVHTAERVNFGDFKRGFESEEEGRERRRQQQQGRQRVSPFSYYKRSVHALSRSTFAKMHCVHGSESLR